MTDALRKATLLSNALDVHRVLWFCLPHHQICTAFRSAASPYSFNTMSASTSGTSSSAQKAYPPTRRTHGGLDNPGAWVFSARYLLLHEETQALRAQQFHLSIFLSIDLPIYRSMYLRTTVAMSVCMYLSIVATPGMSAHMSMQISLS